MTTQFGDVRFGGLGLVSLLGTGLSYLRPDADDLDGGWTTESGTTNLFPSIDESSPPSDSDFIKSSANPTADVCRVRLSNPNALVATPVKIRSRYRKSGSDPVNLTVRLKQGTTEKASWTYAGISNSFLTSEETLTVAQFNSITDFTDLFLEFEATTEDSAFWIVESDFFSSYLDPDVYLWTRAGGASNSTRIELVNDLVLGLKADGVWAKLDRLWLLAADSQASALADLVHHSVATAVNSPTFTVDRGFACDGSSSYIDTLYNPSTNGVNFTLNAASLWIWNNTNRASTSAVSMGCNDASNISDLTVFQPRIEARLNQANGSDSNSSTTTTGSIGFIGGNRSGSSGLAASLQFYFNGVDQGAPFVGSGSTAVPNRTMYIGGRNDQNNGGLQSGITDQISAAVIGGNLSATDALNLYNRLRTYMTAVGVP
jgi:hypothetical protein